MVSKALTHSLTQFKKLPYKSLRKFAQNNAHEWINIKEERGNNNKLLSQSDEFYMNSHETGCVCVVHASQQTKEQQEMAKMKKIENYAQISVTYRNGFVQLLRWKIELKSGRCDKTYLYIESKVLWILQLWAWRTFG